MEILEYGNPKNDKIILIHGFQSDSRFSKSISIME